MLSALPTLLRSVSGNESGVGSFPYYALRCQQMAMLHQFGPIMNENVFSGETAVSICNGEYKIMIRIIMWHAAQLLWWWLWQTLLISVCVQQLEQKNTFHDFVIWTTITPKPTLKYFAVFLSYLVLYHTLKLGNNYLPTDHVIRHLNRNVYRETAREFFFISSSFC